MSESFAHKKSLGQHFLNSDYIPKKLCDAAHVGTGDTILEIGPGTGALTEELLARGAQVVAVEADSRALFLLAERFAGAIEKGQLQLHHSDARTLSPAAFGLANHEYKVVANIPYYLSGYLFRTFLDTPCQPAELVFLVQREVAERIARDKKESLLSLSVKVFGTPSYICTVKRSHFTPPPQVDSAIIAVYDINNERLVNVTAEQFFNILHPGFAQKRKQLLGNLAKTYPRSALMPVFTNLELPLTVRAEDVPLEKWLQLAHYLISTTL